MHQILSTYFREELKQRIWGRGSVLEKPHRVLLGYNVKHVYYIQVFIILNNNTVDP